MSGVELTDITSVRQFMQKSLSDKLQDEDLEILIRQASPAIERFCNRQFVAQPKTLKSFEFLPNESLELIDLKPYEFRTIQKVVLDPDLTPVTLTTAQYRAWPYPARDGTFFGLRFAELPEPVTSNEPALAFQTRRVDVEADWGLASIPPEVQHWTNVTVESWAHMRRDGVPGSVEMQFGEGQLPKPEDLPAAVRWGLKRWVRPTPEA